jgi:hypothetical protein
MLVALTVRVGISLQAQNNNTLPAAGEQTVEEQRALGELAKESRRQRGQVASPNLVASALRAAIGPGNLVATDERFKSKDGGATFTWNSWERYDASWRNWQVLRTVDVSNPQPHKEEVYGYARPLVHPGAVPINLNGCQSTSSDGTLLAFHWTVRRAARVVFDVSNAGCYVALTVPGYGKYDVSLEVTSAAGARDVLVGAIDVKDILIVSFGDSSASGEGNPDDEGLSNGWADRRCHRSKTSGHALTAEALENQSLKSSVTFLSFACSGADFPSGILGPYAGQSPTPASNQFAPTKWQVRDLPSQIDAAREALCSVPVERCSATDMRQPDYIFISIGVNDLGFADVITACGDLDLPVKWYDTLNPALLLFRPFAQQFLRGLLHGSCDEWINFDNAIASALFYLESNHTAIGIPGRFAELRRRLDTAGIVPARGIYLSTYPADIFSSSDGDVERGCKIFVGIDEDEAKFLSAWGRKLNSVIHLEAIRNGMFSVGGITAAFRSHGYCAGNTPLSPPSALSGSQSYFVGLSTSLVKQAGLAGTVHPNRRGHHAIRDEFLKAITADKPDRKVTHRATVIVERFRFDGVPPAEEMNAEMEFLLTPYERVHNGEIIPKTTNDTGVLWKQVIATPKVNVTPDEWLRLSSPLRMEVDLSPADYRILFTAFGTLRWRGNLAPIERRPKPQKDQPAPGQVAVPGSSGGPAFYRVQIGGKRSDGDGLYGRGSYTLKGATDQGKTNPGSMTVEFCVLVGRIQNSVAPPSEAQALTCPANVERK